MRPSLKTTKKLTLAQHRSFTKAYGNQEEYLNDSARVIAMTMCHLNKICVNPIGQRAEQHAQLYIHLMKGHQKFGKKGRDVAYKEV